MRKIIFSLIFVSLYYSCEPYQEVFFKEKANGHRAFGLDGTYIFTYKISDSLQSSDTLRFERTRKNDFLITDLSSKDTIFLGEIVKRKGLFFMNRPSSQKGWWSISAFKFSDDSIYNYLGLYGNRSFSDEIKGQKLFSDFQESDTTFYINNSSSETYNAMEFSVMNGERASYRELLPDKAGEADRTETEKRGEPVFLVYPNPVKENLIIETRSDGNYLLEIMDMNGSTVRKEKFSANYFMINIGNIPNGTYIARLTGNRDGGQNIFRIVVEK